MLKKGSVLDEAAIAALREAGQTEVIAARLEPGDVRGKRQRRPAGAAPSTRPLLSRRRAATGRVNLHADAAGLLRVDAGAARPDQSGGRGADRGDAAGFFAVVAAGAMVATIKVIPFAVPGAVLDRVEAVAREAAPFTLHRFRQLTVGLVLSELPGLKESVIDGTIDAMEARIAGLGGTLLTPLRCPHAATPIAAALRQLREAGAQLLLVAGASATVDRRDVGPAGVVEAGGEIVHFGMPVDPGNLICLGRIGDIPALVLPGCARSPKPNGIDLVLQRIFAGLPVGAPEVMRMGVGGLLKDTDARPLPRAKAAAKAEPVKQSHVAAIVLAAGHSTRMAPFNKLLVADRSGKPMIARVVDNVLSSGARPILVVTGHLSEEIRAALAGRPVTFVDAPDYAQGLSASLKAGIAALPDSAAAAMVCLGDMPLVTGRMIDRLIAAYDPDEGRSIAVPTHQGKIGNPILWDRRYIPGDHAALRRWRGAGAAAGAYGAGRRGRDQRRRRAARFRHAWTAWRRCRNGCGRY